MSSLNFRASPFTERNAAGTPVRAISKEARLTRMTLAHMLWEKQFYIDGQSSAEAIKSLVKDVKPEFVMGLAELARTKFKLRHVPLLLLRELARKGQLRAEALANIIKRPDEMGEFLSIYNMDGKSALSNQVKKGLAGAFGKFNEYSLAKWDKNSANYSVRDVMFLTHPKPTSLEQAALFQRIANKQMVTPDTWETELSAGADKRETFSRLMAENKLGALAFLRNLRNMIESGISEAEIRAYSATVNVENVLPFRFIAAARIVPQLEDMLEQMMFKALEGKEKLKGKTVLFIDMSGSMFNTKVSAKSDLDRIDAALALAVLCRELCEEVEIYTFNDNIARVIPRRGFALIDTAHEAAYAATRYKGVHYQYYNKENLRSTYGYGGTDLQGCLKELGPTDADRIIVFTDEQSYTKTANPPAKLGYILNVASYENGINNSNWVTISGFSEASLDYIQLSETEDV